MSPKPRGLSRLRTVYVGEPGGGDRWSAFVIDGRDYPTPEAAQVDHTAALDELAWRNRRVETVTEYVRPDDPRPTLPTWQAWNARSVVDWPMVLDTDIGGDPDDAVALVAAARTTPALALVTTTDEHRGQRARLARHLLDLAGRPDVPVRAGQPGESRYFCAGGLVPGDVPAQPGGIDGAVAALCAAAQGPVRWVGLGPLTNLAAVLTARPHLAGQLAITQMGGALRYRHPTRAEHNIRLDPPAARAALALARRPRLVVSDVTFTPHNQITPGSDLYHSLARTDTAWARLVRALLDRWFTTYPGSMQHDGLTLTAGMHLPFVAFARHRIALDPAGRMREDPGGIPVRLAATADHAVFLGWLAQALGFSPRKSSNRG